MKRAIVCCVLLVVVLLGLAANALAEPHEDHFDALIAWDGTVTGGGSGYDEGEWFHYENTGWWNQWFYDDPLDLNRRKSIDFSMQAQAEGVVFPLFPVLIVAVNWSSDLYPSDTEPPYVPPLPPLDPTEETAFIVRQIVWEGGVSETEPVVISGHIDIPDYNPEWVSIDIRGLSVRITDGVIRHECLSVPEPGTLALLACGVPALGLVLLWRRQTKRYRDFVTAPVVLS